MSQIKNYLIPALILSTVPFSLAAQQWTGAGGFPPLNWSDNANWTPFAPPSGSPVMLNFNPPSSPMGYQTFNDLPQAIADSIGINPDSGSGYDFSGAPIYFPTSSGILFSVSGSTATNFGNGGFILRTTNLLPLTINHTAADTTSGALNINCVISDDTGFNGAVQISGAGLTVFTSSNTYSGGTTIDSNLGGTAAYLRIENNSGLGTGAVSIGNNGILDLSVSSGSNSNDIAVTTGSLSVRSSDFTLNGIVSGSGISKVGSGTLILANALNSFSTMAVSAGTLQQSASGAIPSSAVMTLSTGATLDLNGTTTVLANLAGSGGTVSLGTNGDLTVGGNNNDSTYSGTITGTGATLTKTGTGTLTLSGALSYSGTTTISSGALVGGFGASSGPIVANGTVSFFVNSDRTYSQPISGTGAVVKTGDNILELSSTSNSYTGGTTISGGTLQISSNSNLGNTSGAVTMENGTTLQFLDGFGTATTARNFSLTGSTAFRTDPSATVTLSGDLSGAAAVNKAGDGTLILTGNNSYSLGNEIFGGTLQGNSSSLLGNIVIHTGTVSFNQTISGTYSGSISGPGPLVKLGSANLTLAGANTYSGQTTISAGTLQGNTTSIPANDIVNNSALVFNQTSDGSFGAVISGSGTLAKIGTGTLTLTGTNTYAGNTAITAGTLQGNTTSIPANNILNNATLVFDQTSDGSFGAIISGSGALTKSGAGTLTLTGTNTYTGPTTVTAGTLSVNGVIDSAVTVSGGILQGNGSITQNVTINSGGELRPGNSIGTISVTGLVTFASGSTYTVEVTPTAADLLVVTGGVGSGVTISNGAILSLVPDPGVYSSPLSLMIIDASGSADGITGTFTTINNSYPLFSPTISVVGNQMFLTLDVAAFNTLVSTGNAAKVAACLNSLAPSAGTDLNSVLGELYVVQSAAELEDALYQMQPSQFTSYAMIQEDLTVQLTSRIKERSAKYHTVCLAGNRPGYSMWAEGFADFSAQDSQGQEPGYHANTGGGIVGVDYAFSPDLLFGGAAAYTYTDFRWRQQAGTGEIQSGYGILYQSYEQPYLAISSNLLAAYNHYQGSRYINFLSTDRVADHTNPGFEVGADLTVGVPITAGNITFTPYIASDFVYLYQYDFQESGAGSIDLYVSDSNAYYVREEGGIDFKGCYTTTHGYRWVLEAGCAYVREWRFDGSVYQSHLKDTSCGFEVRGMAPNRNLIAPSASFTAFFAEDKASLVLSYKGLYGTQFADNTLSGGFSYSF